MAADEVAAEIAVLVRDVTPYVVAAASAYGGAVVAKTQDKAADTTVGMGLRVLERVFGRRKAGDPVPEVVTDVLTHPGNDMFVSALIAKICKALESDEALRNQVRALIPAEPQSSMVQNIHNDGDAYVSGRDMIVHQHRQ